MHSGSKFNSKRGTGPPPNRQKIEEKRYKSYPWPKNVITLSPLLPTGNGDNKVVIINFDDSFKNQVLYPKQILDKYGFKTGSVDKYNLEYLAAIFVQALEDYLKKRSDVS